mmetsp:Transcript_30084/g.57992  ORF Transcript_30084/g.57992 Transcript_30084/m.57992 type:complete len:730 (+) Transcript_30084:54-2243(+)
MAALYALAALFLHPLRTPTPLHASSRATIAPVAPRRALQPRASLWSRRGVTRPSLPQDPCSPRVARRSENAPGRRRVAAASSYDGGLDAGRSGGTMIGEGELLDRVYEAVYASKPPPREIEYTTVMEEANIVQAFGRFRMRMTDGAFFGMDREGYVGEDEPLSNMYGYDGDGKAWVFDSSACEAFELQLDERQAAIQVLWIFHSLYAVPTMRDKFSTKILPAAPDGSANIALRITLKPDDAEDLSPHLRANPEMWQATSVVYIDPDTFMPLYVNTYYCNNEKQLFFSEWKQALGMLNAARTSSREIDGRVLSGEIVSLRDATGETDDGESETSTTTSTMTSTESTDEIPQFPPDDYLIQMPEALRQDPRTSDAYSKPMVKRPNVHFDHTVSPEMEFRSSRSGHVLIPAKINGQDLGYWLLDTGCSNNVITTWAAKRLELQKFGAMEASVLGGSAESGLVKIETFETGPLRLSDSVFHIMDLPSTQNEGVKIAGILGYDFFSYAVVEMDLDVRDVFGGFQSKRLLLREPDGTGETTDTDTESDIYETEDMPLSLTPLRFLSKVAHVDACVKGKMSDECPCLMMFDLGAAGSNVILNTDKAIMTGAVSRDAVTGGGGFIMGAAGDNVQASKADVESLEIAGHRVPRAVHATLLDAHQDLSPATNGVLGIDAFWNCRLVIDYPNRQLGVRPLVPKLNKAPTWLGKLGNSVSRRGALRSVTNSLPNLMKKNDD